MIYLLTVNYYSTLLVAQLLNSIPENNCIPYKITLVNNSPEDSSLYNLKRDFIEIIESQTNLGFAKACNKGLNWIYARDPNAIIWIINPDAYLLKNALEKVSAFWEANPRISILGTVVYTPRGEIWFAGGRFVPKLGAILSTDMLSSNPEAEYVLSDWVTGCSLLINLKNFSQCPQFDPEYFLYYEDFDFCQRYASQGHLVAIATQIGVVHEPSSITNRNLYNKMKHSTYSYLLTMQKYTNFLVLSLRLSRIVLHALILLMVNPHVALGKLCGVLNYLRRALEACSTQSW